ncbi:MAG: hypothetical protein RLZZ210_536 [Pseudomonadota bacterium]
MEIDKENSNKIIAHHELRSNLIVSINKILSIITIQSFYNIKKPRWGKKKNFLNALNKANSSNWLCTFVSYEPFDTLAILSFIYISEKLSTQDIAQFLEHYENCLNSAINNSGIREFT